MTLDGLDGDGIYLVDDMSIHHHGIIFLARVSSLKKKLLHAAHTNFLAMHLDAYFALLEEFTWEGIHHDIYQHMERCIARLMMERTSKPLPYSLEVRENF